MKIMLKKSPYGLYPVTDRGQQWLASQELGAEFEATMPNESLGTVPMLRTWRKWMAETARHMAASGCTMPMYIDKHGEHHGRRPFNADDAHELFTSLYLGTDEHGRRKSWSLSSNDDEVQASMGDRLWAMDQHVIWCTERGIKLTIPRNSEYQKHREEQAA